MINFRLVLFTCLTIPNVSLAATFIGTQVPPYPDGIESRSGACIALIWGHERTCDVSVGTLARTGENPFAIIVKRKIGLSGKSVLWEVTDQIPYPKIRAGESFSFLWCRVEGKFDATIVAVVRLSDSRWLPAVNWAKKINLESGTVSTISSQDVECENQDWGL